jgi:hypothetical protein
MSISKSIQSSTRKDNMRKSAKSIKRLGLVAGVGTVAGLMPIAGLSAVYASTPTNASLALSTATPGATSVATNTFTTTTATESSTGLDTITITSNSAPGTQSTATSEQLPTNAGNYTVSYTGEPTGYAATAVTATANTATLTLPSSIPAGTAVTVSIVGVTNATAPSTVYFSDATAGDTTAVRTNTVSISSGTSAVASVTGVNPTDVPATTATPFTLTGTFFGSTSAGGTITNAPDVYFFPTTSTPSSTPAGAIAAGGIAATVTFVSATEIQGTSPATLSGQTAYDVVVYNVNPAVADTFQAPSTTSASDQVSAGYDLDFVTENGVRVADSRSGTNLPTGAIPSGVTVAVPVSGLLNSPTQPSNIPTTATALALNVTAIAPGSAGNLQVTSAATSCTATTATTPETGTSTVNFQPGQDTSNSTIVHLATAGAGVLCVRDVGASVNVTLDVVGYENGAGDYTGTQTRLLDTRPSSQVGNLQGPLASGTVYPVYTGLDDGTPVAINVTAVDPQAPGNLRVFPEPDSGTASPSAVPTTAVVNYIPGTDSGSLFVTTTGDGGVIDIYSDSSAPVNVVIDEAGTFTGATDVTAITTNPYRVLDTRPGGIAAGSSVSAQAVPSGSGQSFTPGSALAVIGSLSDINPSGQGYETVYPSGYPVNNTASIANYPGQVRENLAFAPVSPSTGQFSISNVGASTNSTFDVGAYVASDPTPVP